MGELFSNNIVSFSIALLFLCVMIGGFIYLKWFLDKYRDEEKRAEREFENSILAQFKGARADIQNGAKVSQNNSIGAASDENAVSPIPSSPDFVMPEQFDPQVKEAQTAPFLSSAAPNSASSVSGAPLISPADPALKSRKATDDIIAKLDSAGIVKNVEGPIVLQRKDAAMMVHLKSGRTVLLIPYYESENFVIANLPKADCLIFILSNGEAIAVESLSRFLARSIT